MGFLPKQVKKKTASKINLKQKLDKERMIEVN